MFRYSSFLRYFASYKSTDQFVFVGLFGDPVDFASIFRLFSLPQVGNADEFRRPRFGRTGRAMLAILGQIGPPLNVYPVHIVERQVDRPVSEGLWFHLAWILHHVGSPEIRNELFALESNISNRMLSEWLERHLFLRYSMLTVGFPLEVVRKRLRP